MIFKNQLFSKVITNMNPMRAIPKLSLFLTGSDLNINGPSSKNDCEKLNKGNSKIDQYPNLPRSPWTHVCQSYKPINQNRKSMKIFEYVKWNICTCHYGAFLNIEYIKWNICTCHYGAFVLKEKGKIQNFV